MKVARIELDNGTVTWAVQQADGMLHRATGDLMEGGLSISREVVAPARWLPPVAPRAIFCIGRNYAAHAAEGGAPPPEYPILFMKNLSAAIGHEETILLPKVCDDEVDFEGELVVVIGKPASSVSKADALKHVLGYTIGHDVSARIWQDKKGGSQWCRGKSFDTFAPLGPVLVTPDELPDPQKLTVRTTHNGTEVQHGFTSNMIFDVATLISFLSEDTTLLPGTVIMTGTPEGIGWARNPKLTLRSGDEVTITIDGIGSLRNTVASKA